MNNTCTEYYIVSTVALENYDGHGGALLCKTSTMTDEDNIVQYKDTYMEGYEPEGQEPEGQQAEKSSQMNEDFETVDNLLYLRHQPRMDSYNRIFKVNSQGFIGSVNFFPSKYAIDWNSFRFQFRIEYKTYVASPSSKNTSIVNVNLTNEDPAERKVNFIENRDILLFFDNQKVPPCKIDMQNISKIVFKNINSIGKEGGFKFQAFQLKCANHRLCLDKRILADVIFETFPRSAKYYRGQVYFSEKANGLLSLSSINLCGRRKQFYYEH